MAPPELNVASVFRNELNVAGTSTNKILRAIGIEGCISTTWAIVPSKHINIEIVSLTALQLEYHTDQATGNTILHTVNYVKLHREGSCSYMCKHAYVLGQLAIYSRTTACKCKHSISLQILCLWLAITSVV